MNSVDPQPTHSNSSHPAETPAALQTPPPVEKPPKKRRFAQFAVVFAIALFAIGAGGAGYLLNDQLRMGGTASDLTQRPTVAEDGNKIVTKDEEDTASVVAKVSPSVVSIVTQTGSSDARSRFMPTQEGAGTGIIVSKDGYILTNNHVIDGATTVNVITSDGTSYDDVKVLGSDPLNDVAFLKISGVSDLPVAELGDSTSIRVGQRVIAIGNSLGQYQNTVTSGIISGTGRPVSAQSGSSVESLTDLIQTDAAINPGNSGGPLLNLQGQVIGINTAVAQDAQGIGFSIPIGAAKGMLKSVLAGKGVQRAFLGLSYVPITAEVADYYKLSVKKGAYVYNGDKTAVTSGSPADKAGVQENDIITKIGDISVGDRGGVATLVAEYTPGDTIQITVLRGSKTIDLRVTLAAYQP